MKPLGIVKKDTHTYDAEIPLERMSKNFPSVKSPDHSLSMAKESVTRKYRRLSSTLDWSIKFWSFLQRKFVLVLVLVLGSLHLTVMAALGLCLWSFPYRHELTQAQRPSLTLDLTPLRCTSTTLFRSDIPLTSALNRASIVFYTVFLAPRLNLVVPAAFFLLLLM